MAGVETFVHNLETAPLPQLFDHITCFETLEHIPRVAAAFRTLKAESRETRFASIPNVGCRRCRVRLALCGKAFSNWQVRRQRNAHATR